jgi:hypothetical protein
LYDSDEPATIHFTDHHRWSRFFLFFLHTLYHKLNISNACIKCVL